ncbi:MAG: glycosyltransferase [Ignavibacteria bacterium]
MNKGVSIVVCCYNSSKLLTETLQQITSMKVRPGIQWEIIIVDNNSSDNTTETAKKLMAEYSTRVPYKILFQSVQGLSSARKMGLDNSRYEYVIFCDDDNRLNSDYIDLSFDIMEKNKNIGALGGESEADADENLPEWFERYQQNYAVGSQSQISGDITWTHGSLWGAGIIIRKSAVEELFSKGYRSLLSDRTKDSLTSGGDVELCYALRLAGWKIWYQPALKIKHHIEHNRLNWNYLRKLNRGFGEQKVVFDAYLKALEPEPRNFNQSIKQNWYYQFIRLLKKFRGYGFRKLIRFNDPYEGDPEILRIEKSVGRLKQLIKIRGEYYKGIVSIRKASWRKVFLPENI